MRRILVVEELEATREVVCLTLEMHDFELAEARDAEAALELAASWNPDAVVTGVRMPGAIDGLEACRRIKQDPKLRRTKVIVLSSLNTPQDIAAGYRAGADAYLTKPFSPLELLATVDRVLA